MKSLGQVATRYLLEKKKRTILNIIGIIISVAMITSIGTMFYSMEQFELKTIIKTAGYNHGAFLNITNEQFQFLKDNIGFDKTAKSVELGTGYWESASGKITYLQIVGYENEYLEMRNMLPIEGRLPQRENEIVVERWKARELGVEIGGEIEIPIGSLTNVDGSNITRGWNSYDEATFKQASVHSFKLVGIIESARFSQIWGHSRAIVDLSWAERVNGTDEVTAIVRVKDGLDPFTIISNVSRELNIDDSQVQLNYNLIRREMGKIDPSILAILAFLIGIVCVATIAVIFNSFNISVLERIKQFGIMRSIGTTPWQIRKVVFAEATIVSLVSIPLGLAAGFYGTKFMFYLLTLGQFSSFNNLTIIANARVFLWSSIIAIGTVYLSALIPAISAGRVTPLDAIFSYRSLKEGRKSRRGFLVGKVFGSEGLLAYKNIQRNRKRLMITAFSISISVIMFIVFNIFSSYALRANQNLFRYSADFELEVSGQELFTEVELNEIIRNEGISNVEPLRLKQITALLEGDKLSQFLKDYSMLIAESGILPHSFLKGYNDSQINQLNNVLKDGTIDINLINREQGVLVVLNSEYFDPEEQKRVIRQDVDLKVGDVIQISLTTLDNEWDLQKFKENVTKDVISLKVVGIVERSIIGVMYPYMGSIGLITSQEVYEKITGISGYNFLYVTMHEDGNYNEVFTLLESIVNRRNDATMFDNIASSRREKQMMLEISVLIYGFITLISLIGTLNIINTISTNLLTRTKEFSMLRAVGMSPLSMKKMIRLEAIFSSFMGTIFGLIVGNLLGYFLYTLLTIYDNYPWEFPLKANIIAVMATLLIALLASIAPTNKIRSLNIIDNLREE